MSGIEKWFLIVPIRMIVLTASLLTVGNACQKKNTAPISGENHASTPTANSLGSGSNFCADLNLRNSVPLSKSTLKKFLPEKIGDYLKKQMLIGHKEPIEISAIQGTYHHMDETTRTILIDIMDGAGPVASVLLAGSKQKLSLDFEEVKADGFSRVHERKGQRVWQAENRLDEVAELEFIHAGRFLVSIKGQRLQSEDLWIFADKLEFNGMQ